MGEPQKNIREKVYKKELWGGGECRAAERKCAVDSELCFNFNLPTYTPYGLSMWLIFL